MSPGHSSNADILQALQRLKAQAAHLVRRGRPAFLAEDLDGDLNRLAGEGLIIALQSALEDLPEGFIEQHSDLPFRLVRGMRNRLAHGYDDVDAGLLWSTMQHRLREFIDAVIDRLDPGDS